MDLALVGAAASGSTAGLGSAVLSVLWSGVRGQQYSLYSGLGVFEFLHSMAEQLLSHNEIQ